MKPVASTGRRQVLKAITLSLPATMAARAAPQPAPEALANPAGADPVWRFFNQDEARAVQAIAARLIPADELGPGALEAGVPAFLDSQLAGAWGSGDHLYRQGPYAQGTPQQGYQLSYTPAEMFRTGLAKLDERVRLRSGGKRFADLPAAEQDTWLAQMEKGELDFSPLPSALFFAAMMDAVVEGYFCDPIHGGNAGMAGWKLVGFPGAYASYANDIERHGMQWTREPVSIADGPMHPAMQHKGS